MTETITIKFVNKKPTLKINAKTLKEAIEKSKADLSEVNLSKANLIGAFLRKANLIGADLIGAKINRNQIQTIITNLGIHITI